LPVKAPGVVKYEVEEYETADGACPYVDWIRGLRDKQGQAKIRVRIDRVKIGNFGEHRGVGEGVKELVINFGPGYRVYYGHDGDKIIILLGGGDKKTQVEDIRRAKLHWAEYWR
jgi:putative addiction module killer protein